MVLVTGPTGSGKSTTLAGIVDLVNSERKDHVITIDHDEDLNRGAEASTSWNLVSKNNQDTVSGIYIYHVKSLVDGSETVGKFVIIR